MFIEAEMGENSRPGSIEFRDQLSSARDRSSKELQIDASLAGQEASASDDAHAAVVDEELVMSSQAVQKLRHELELAAERLKLSVPSKSPSSEIQRNLAGGENVGFGPDASADDMQDQESLIEVDISSWPTLLSGKSNAVPSDAADEPQSIASFQQHGSAVLKDARESIKFSESEESFVTSMSESDVE